MNPNALAFSPSYNPPDNPLSGSDHNPRQAPLYWRNPYKADGARDLAVARFIYPFTYPLGSQPGHQSSHLLTTTDTVLAKKWWLYQASSQGEIGDRMAKSGLNIFADLLRIHKISEAASLLNFFGKKNYFEDGLFEMLLNICNTCCSEHNAKEMPENVVLLGKTTLSRLQSMQLNASEQQTAQLPPVLQRLIPSLSWIIQELFKQRKYESTLLGIDILASLTHLSVPVDLLDGLKELFYESCHQMSEIKNMIPIDRAVSWIIFARHQKTWVQTAKQQEFIVVLIKNLFEIRCHERYQQAWTPEADRLALECLSYLKVSELNESSRETLQDTCDSRIQQLVQSKNFEMIEKILSHSGVLPEEKVTEYQLVIIENLIASSQLEKAWDTLKGIMAKPKGPNDEARPTMDLHLVDRITQWLEHCESTETELLLRLTDEIKTYLRPLLRNLKENSLSREATRLLLTLNKIQALQPFLKERVHDLLWCCQQTVTKPHQTTEDVNSVLKLLEIAKKADGFSKTDHLLLAEIYCSLSLHLFQNQDDTQGQYWSRALSTLALKKLWNENAYENVVFCATECLKRCQDTKTAILLHNYLKLLSPPPSEEYEALLVEILEVQYDSNNYSGCAHMLKNNHSFIMRSGKVAFFQTFVKKVIKALIDSKSVENLEKAISLLTLFEVIDTNFWREMLEAARNSKNEKLKNRAWNSWKVAGKDKRLQISNKDYLQCWLYALQILSGVKNIEILEMLDSIDNLTTVEMGSNPTQIKEIHAILLWGCLTTIESQNSTFSLSDERLLKLYDLRSRTSPYKNQKKRQNWYRNIDLHLFRLSARSVNPNILDKSLKLLQDALKDVHFRSLFQRVASGGGHTDQPSRNDQHIYRLMKAAIKHSTEKRAFFQLEQCLENAAISSMLEKNQYDYLWQLLILTQFRLALESEQWGEIDQISVLETFISKSKHCASDFSKLEECVFRFVDLNLEVLRRYKNIDRFIQLYHTSIPSLTLILKNTLFLRNPSTSRCYLTRSEQVEVLFPLLLRAPQKFIEAIEKGRITDPKQVDFLYFKVLAEMRGLFSEHSPINDSNFKPYQAIMSLLERFCAFVPPKNENSAKHVDHLINASTILEGAQKYGPLVKNEKKRFKQNLVSFIEIMLKAIEEKKVDDTQLAKLSERVKINLQYGVKNAILSQDIFLSLYRRYLFAFSPSGNCESEGYKNHLNNAYDLLHLPNAQACFRQQDRFFCEATLYMSLELPDCHAISEKVKSSAIVSIIERLLKFNSYIILDRIIKILKKNKKKLLDHHIAPCFLKIFSKMKEYPIDSPEALRLPGLLKECTSLKSFGESAKPKSLRTLAILLVIDVAAFCDKNIKSENPNFQALNNLLTNLMRFLYTICNDDLFDQHFGEILDPLSYLLKTYHSLDSMTPTLMPSHLALAFLKITHPERLEDPATQKKRAELVKQYILTMYEISEGQWKQDISIMSETFFTKTSIFEGHEDLIQEIKDKLKTT